MRLGPLLVGASIFFGSGVANAALTSSEKGQIKDFVVGARVENAHKVRALVARTDLTAEESASVLGDSLVAVAFTEERGAFLKAVAFGEASAASRPVLVVSEVRALLARADSIYQRFVGGLDHEPKAIDELIAIYAFIDRTIANAGKPTSTAHDGAAGISSATYDETSKVLRDHVERQARWLKGNAAVPESVSRLRAQAHLALIDLLPDGLTRRVDAANRLGLTGARRALLSEWGLLFADGGKADDTKIERIRQVLGRLPSVTRELAVIYVGADRGPLVARGNVLRVGSSAEPFPFAGGGAPASYDREVGAVVYEIAVLVAKRALESRPELRALVEHDAAAASGDSERLLGRPHAPSVEHVLGGAVHASLIDAARAVDLSAARLQWSRPETAALLSDALGALAVEQAGDADAKTPSTQLELGKDGGSVPATAVRVAANGASLSFTLDGHVWAIDRPAPSFAVSGMTRDGKPPPRPAAKGK